jgi:hypothetical protein
MLTDIGETAYSAEMAFSCQYNKHNFLHVIIIIVEKWKGD